MLVRVRERIYIIYGRIYGLLFRTRKISITGGDTVGHSHIAGDDIGNKGFIPIDPTDII